MSGLCTHNDTWGVHNMSISTCAQDVPQHNNIEYALNAYMKAQQLSQHWLSGLTHAECVFLEYAYPDTLRAETDSIKGQNHDVCESASGLKLLQMDQPGWRGTRPCLTSFKLFSICAFSSLNRARHSASAEATFHLHGRTGAWAHELFWCMGA